MTLLKKYEKRVGELQVAERGLKERIKKLTAEANSAEMKLSRATVKFYSWQKIFEDPSVLQKETEQGIRLMHAVVHAWIKNKEKRPEGMKEEDVKKYYDLVVTEMKRREMSYTKLGAPVYSIRDKPLGEVVSLEELLGFYNEPVVIREGVVKLIGGIPSWGESKGDIDVLIDMPNDTPESILHPIRFRVGRALPPELSWRMQFQDPSNSENLSPFTSFETLYDLILMPHQRFVEMAGGITLGKFVPVPKTSVGYHEGEVTEIEQVVSRFKADEYPIVVEKKFDGLVVEWHKSKDKIVAFTDSGKRCESRFPSLVDKLSKHPCSELLFLSEVEGWEDKLHQGREVISGYVNKHSQPDDSHVVANVFDILWCKLPARHHDLQPEGDIHSWPLEQRIRLREIVSNLGNWSETEKIPKHGFNNVISHELTKPDSKALTIILTTIRDLPGSEGSMIKSIQDDFPLTGHIASWVKYKKSADIHVVVIKRNPTRVVSTFNYNVGLLATKDMPRVEEMILGGKKMFVMNIGKTSNIAKSYKTGDILTVMPHTLFKYEDGHVTIYECPIYEERPEQKLPDTLKEAVKIASNKGILREKRQKELDQGISSQDEKSFVKSQENALLNGNENLEYVLQLHPRGKSLHLDLRMENTPDGSLEGLTVAADKGKVTEPVESVAAARAIEKDWSTYLRPVDEAGVQLLIPNRKKNQDHNWLIMNNRVDKPGGIIATKNEYGVMIIVDKGSFERGAQKAYYKEYFFYGKRLNGRYVLRVLTLQGKATWMFWKTKTSEPYVLSSRAIREGWFPSEGSALPKTVESKVPDDLRFWESSGEERISKRKELRKQWLKKLSPSRYLLQYQWWRGQIVKRAGPSKEKYLFRAIIDSKVLEFDMTKDPRSEKVPGRLKEEKYDEFWDIKDETIAIPPGTKYNATKDTPSYLMTLNSGILKAVEQSDTKLVFQVGDKTFTASRSGPKAEWFECRLV